MKNENTKAEAAPANGQHTPAYYKIGEADEYCAYLESLNGFDVATLHRVLPDEVSDANHKLHCLSDEQWQEVINAVHAAPLQLAERDRLRAALTDVFSLMEERWLVRNPSEDAKPGFAMRQLGPARRLSEARAALEGGKP